MGRYVLPKPEGIPLNKGLGGLPRDFLESMHEARMRARHLEAAIRRPNIPLPMDETPTFTAIGYQISLVPDVLYPFDQGHVARVRQALDPSFTPIFRKLIYKARTGGIYVFYHHGIAAYDERVTDDPLVVQMAVKPRWASGSVRPNHIARWFEAPYRAHSHNGVPSWRELHALPKPFMPWSSDIVGWAFDTYWAADPAEKWKFLEAAAAAAEHDKLAAYQKAERAAEERGREELPLQRRLQDELDNPQSRREVLGLVSGLERGATRPSVYVNEKERKSA